MARAFLLLIFGTFLIAAIISPPVMSLIYWIHPETRWPFSRIFGRAAQVVAFFLIIYLRKSFNLGELKNKLKEGSILRKSGHLLSGVLITAISMAVVIPLLVSSGTLEYIGPAPGDFSRILIEVFLAMLLVSFLEETFFRVLIFSSLKSVLNVIVAAIFTSALYAIVHFIAPVKSFKYTSFDPFAGFEYLSEVYARFIEPGVYPAIFGLFLVGMILCYVMHKTNSLYLCIGLHLGWAAGLKIIKFITAFPGGAEISNDLTGRYFLVAQPQAWLSMIFVFLVIFLFLKTRKS